MAAFIAAAVLFSPALAVGVSIQPPTAGEPVTDPGPSTPNTCDTATVKFHVKKARQTIKVAYAYKHWRHRHPVKPEQRFAIHEHVSCLERRKDRAKVSRYRGHQQARFKLYRRFRLVTPFPGYTGRGIWLTHLAVPRYIVDCESHGNWFAYNPSGAAWLYQLLGWGAPRPSSARAKVRNHEIAHEVSGGSRNFSPWVCA